MALVSAEACDPQISLLNQDPYPAVPGEYVKIVFQVTGLDNPECGDFSFTLLQDYPIVLDTTDSGLRTFKKVNYIKDYDSYLQIPYNVRIDNDALDGSNPIDIRAQVAGKPTILKTFGIEVKETKVRFETYVKDYDYTTRDLTIEVLNISRP